MTAEEIAEGLDNEILLAIERDVSSKTGFCFEAEDIAYIGALTARKCEINHKGRNYFYILFENELRDFVARAAINRRSAEIMQRRSEMCEGGERIVYG